MSGAKISIIIPVYRTERYLEKCVQSVLASEFREIEALLIDDGSPDNSGALCDKMAEKDARVRVVHRVNQGLSAARNEGLRRASAPYVSFVDSDDWIHPQMFGELYRLIIEHNAQIASCGFLECPDSAEAFVKLPVTPQVNVLNGMTALSMLLMSRASASHTAWGKLYDRKLFDGVEYPVGRMYEDAATTYKLYYKCGKAVHIKAPY
ncbi:MAG: glycosyltransferase, partial [Clostridiales bacterium]|nr:glycosyltransferase [Clostridiales bacterium]